MASIAVMVLIETDNPLLLYPDEAVRTAEGTAALRQAVLDNLPNVTRVINVMTEESAQFMCRAHDAAMRASGLGDFIKRPPPDYVSPADETDHDWGRADG
jgi:hypothetical protein